MLEARPGHTRHGAYLTPEYKVWQAMLDRCRNERNKRYASYGGRGITVCEDWQTFEGFIADMGLGPSDRHSIERSDNERGYEPGNCVWALPKPQMRNRRNTRFVDVEGSQVPLAELADRSGIPANTLRFRILKGWALDRALSQPVRPKAPRHRAEPIPS